MLKGWRSRASLSRRSSLAIQVDHIHGHSHDQLLKRSSMTEKENSVLDFYYWPTPNGWKVAILLEELVEALGISYNVIPVNIAKGDQFTEVFTALSPNNKIPAICDHSPALEDAVDPFCVFESGAILQYLSEKYQRFIPLKASEKWECIQWLFWQVGGLGPMGGQAHHFRRYAKEDIPYARDRYYRECLRLYGVMDRRLTERSFLCGDYTVADMACLPWIHRHEWQGINLEEFPCLKRWYDELLERPAVQKGLLLGKGWRKDSDFQSDEARRLLFGESTTTDSEED